METQEMKPLYTHSSSYAREHQELDQFRASHWENVACRKAIEDAISTSFDGHHLDMAAVTDVLEAYGAERMKFVLASTVHEKSWDGRFSRDNKEWAEQHCKLTDDLDNGQYYDHRQEYAVSSHPAVLDGYVTMARKKIREREAPSIQSALKEAQDSRHPHLPNRQTGKKVQQER